MNDPVNNLGVTESEWNQWKEASIKWRAENPEPRHNPYELCDCPDIPSLNGKHGHCAVRGTIVEWSPAVTNLRSDPKHTAHSMLLLAKTRLMQAKEFLLASGFHGDYVDETDLESALIEMIDQIECEERKWRKENSLPPKSDTYDLPPSA